MFLKTFIERMSRMSLFLLLKLTVKEVNASCCRPDLDVKCGVVLQSYCERPRHPCGPEPSHQGGSGGGVRHSCSTAESAACSPAAGRCPPSAPLIPTSPHPPSCSESTQLCNQQEAL